MGSTRRRRQGDEIRKLPVTTTNEIGQLSHDVIDHGDDVAGRGHCRMRIAPGTANLCRGLLGLGRGEDLFSFVLPLLRFAQLGFCFRKVLEAC